tara:strand:- start:992 stop:2002 length:1011 start_codon:yes stop_codon:yes gene_type:complete
MKLIFFSFKASYRKMLFNNFIKNRIYGKYLVINLGGPLKHYIAKFLLFLGVGRGISCDGNPLISNISKGINFWSRNSLHLPENEKKLNNNFFAIRNNHISQNNIFQIYPLKVFRSKIKKNPKIIFISRMDTEVKPEIKNLWDINKSQLLQNFNLLDDIDYWNKNILDTKNENDKYTLYLKLKLLLRYEVVKSLKNKFDNQMEIIGNDWSNYPIKSSPSPEIGSKEYNLKKIYNIYKGNICLDLGSLVGSISLYHRSMQIIEAGGLIIQSNQIDSKETWGNLYDKLIFNNINEGILMIEKILYDDEYCSFLFNEIYNKFNKSDKLMEQSLDKVFSNT